MKTLPIYTYGFDVLRGKTKKVNKVDDPLVEIVRNMFHTMHRANGIGLAAPQVGLDIALTVVDVSKIEGEEDKKPLTLINPKVVDSHGRVVMEEGCLSIPYIRAEVTRPDKVFIEYNDLNMKKSTLELDGLLSRVVQHEIDHLNGVLFVDHLSKEMKKQLKDRLGMIKRGEVKVDYQLAEIKTKKKKSAADARQQMLDRI